jgi:hypothetical protein
MIMLYFKTVHLNSNNYEAVENALRKHSWKRGSSLDFQSSASLASDDKFFLGVEDEVCLRFTRLRTPFERFLPKIILAYPKSIQDSLAYRIRLSFLPSVLFVLLTIALVLNIIFSITEMRIDTDLPKVFFLFVVFILLTFFEIYLTERRVKKIFKIENLSVSFR